MAEPTITAVEALCAELILELGHSPAAADVKAIHEKLHEPLRVAIGGRLKAGKSTLVNALIGQRVAQVDAGECTKSVYWYRYGDDPRIEVTTTDGHSYGVPFVEGTVPADLGRPPESIDRVQVWLRVPALKDMVIIDTPGLETLNEQYSARTKEFLGVGAAEQRAVSHADVLVYLMTQPKDPDLVTLESFRNAFPGGQLSALNAIGVLSRIDTLSGDDDPWPAARSNTAKYTQKLRTVLATITPVIGKLGETVECGALTERHFNSLLQIAAVEPPVWAMMRRSATQFATYVKCDVQVGARDELLSLLGFYAAKRSVEWVRSGRCPNLASLVDALRSESGIDELQSLFASAFSSRAAVLKAGVSLAQLTAVYWTHHRSHPALKDLLDRLEALERQPVMHQLEEARIMRLMAAGQVELPEERLDEIRRMVTAVDPAAKVGLEPGAGATEIAAAAAAKESEWNGIEQTVPFSKNDVPRAMKLSYALLRSSLR